MEEFLEKILPFLLVFGLIASNAVNGGPLQEKMKKGKNHDVTGNRKTVYGGKSECFTKHFAGNAPPEGLRSRMNFFIKYICQKDYNEDGTHYGTMFDKQFGIPVYSAYTLTKDKVDFKARTRPKKWRQTEGIKEQGSDEIYPSLPFHRGHLAPAQTLSDTGYDGAGFRSTFFYTNAVPQRPAFNSGLWSQFERKIRDYAINDCTKDDGTLYLLTGTLFTNWNPHTDQKLVNDPSREPKLENKDLPQFLPITIPSSLWTAGCCVKNGVAVENFAVFGNNREDPNETYTTQASMNKLQAVIKDDIASDQPKEVKLFPAFPGCMDDAKKVDLNARRVD